MEKLLLIKIWIILIGQLSGEFTSDPPFYSEIYAEIPFARGMVVDPSGDILIATREFESKLFILYETINETYGTVQVNKKVLLDAPDLKINHGLAFHRTHIYASSASTVFRWPYVPGSRTPLDQFQAEIVVQNIPSEGIEYISHFTRTILFDTQDQLFVQCGAHFDVDEDSKRARIHRFNLTMLIPSGGFDFYEDGLIFAEGVRNTVGLGLDRLGRLWGVENSVNFPVREDLGENIIPGNPAEELNLFDVPGRHYGYPYCFSSYYLPGYEANTQFVYDSFMGNGSIYTDEWCRNEANNHPPVLTLPAHTAPLDVNFYSNVAACSQEDGAFPCSAIGDAFITFHAAEKLPLENQTFYGYRLVWFPFDEESNLPTGEMITVLYDDEFASGNCTGQRCILPVHSVFDRKGHLFVSSDYKNAIYKITYNDTSVK